MSYEIVCQPGEKGTKKISMEKLVFVTVNDKPISPEMEKNLKPAVKAFDDMPVFLVGKDGRLSGIEGVGKMLQSVEEMKNRGNQETSSKLAESPQTDALLKAILGEYWTCWVEAWIDFPVSNGSPVTEPFEDELFPGQPKLKGTRTSVHVGVIAGSPRVHHLKTEITVSDPRLTMVVLEMLKKIDKTNGKTSETNAEDVPELQSTTTLEVKIDPATLRPTWAKREKWIRPLKPDSRSRGNERKETHEYFFSW